MHSGVLWSSYVFRDFFFSGENSGLLYISGCFTWERMNKWQCLLCFSAVNFSWHHTHTKPCGVPNIFRLHNTFFKSYWNKQNSFCLNCIYVSKENTVFRIFLILTHLFLHFSIYRENSRWISELIITLNCASWEWHFILSYYLNFPKASVERSWKTLFILVMVWPKKLWLEVSRFLLILPCLE